MPSSGVGWQPSRFLADRAEAKHTSAPAERLGSVNVAAAELGATWPSPRPGRQRHHTLGLSLAPELAQLTRTYGRRVQRSSP